METWLLLALVAALLAILVLLAGFARGRRRRREELRRMAERAKPLEPHIKDLILQAYHAAQGEGGWAELGNVGNQLRILEPGFDSRKYGRRQL